MSLIDCEIIFCVGLDILFPIPNIRSLLRSAIRGIDMAYGGIIMSLRVPKQHSSDTHERQVLWVLIKIKDFPFVIIIHSMLTVIPHHSHLIPARHSLDQQIFRQIAHLELVGKLPSRQR